MPLKHCSTIVRGDSEESHHIPEKEDIKEKIIATTDTDQIVEDITEEIARTETNNLKTEEVKTNAQDPDPEEIAPPDEPTTVKSST